MLPSPLWSSPTILTPRTMSRVDSLDGALDPVVSNLGLMHSHLVPDGEKGVRGFPLFTRDRFAGCTVS